MPRTSRPCALLFLFLAASFAPLYAESVAADSGWKLKLGDDPSWSSPVFDDSGWETVKVPGHILLPRTGSWFWLRAKHAIPEALAAAGPVWFDIGKIGCVAEVFMNGRYVGTRGSMPPEYILRLQLSDTFLVPEDSRTSGEPLSIALRCYYLGNNPVIPGFAFGDRAMYETVNYLQNMLNADVYVILAVLCLFLGVYFTFQFASNRSETSNLYYALSLIAIAVYFYEMGARWWVPTNLFLRALAKSCLSLSVGSILLFYTSFFRTFHNRIVKALVALDVVIFSALLFANSHDDTALMSFFSLSLLPIFAGIFFGIFVLTKAVIRKNRDAVPILAGLAVGMGFGIHDIVYQVIGGSPFAWLQGYTFFSLNVSVFIALALRDSRMERDLAASIATMERQKDELARFASGIRTALPELAEVSASLEGSAGDVSRSTEVTAVSVERIGAAVGAQNALVSEVVTAMQELLESIDGIGALLGEQARELADNAEKVTSVSAGIGKVGFDVKKAASKSSVFSQTASGGEREMEELSASMKSVADIVGEIHAITAAVNDFAERTNMLAMNASIEAAHAGAAGKGFAVIAHEIKRLAAASAEKAGRIGEIAGQIGERTDTAISSVGRMRESLRTISDGAALTAEAMREAAELTERQRAESAEIDASISRLSASSRDIRNETIRQTELSVRVKERVGALQSEGALTGSAAADIRDRTGTLLGETKALAELAARTRSVIGYFEELTRER